MNNRYLKQKLFLGDKGQKKIENSHAIILGAGALGSATAEMLVRAGVGTITIVDRDYVEWSNLQRQQLYTEEDAENKLPKAIAAQKRLAALNSEITVKSIVTDINVNNIEELIEDVSIMIDATDNFETRLILNDAAVKHNIPFVFGACVSSYGLTFSIQPHETPCLHCLINHLPSQNITCDTVGVISPIVQLVAAFQVTQAMQLITGYKVEPILWSHDIWKMEKSEINVAKLKNENCPTCGKNAVYPYLSLQSQTKTDVLCGRDAIHIRPGSARVLDLKQLSKVWKDTVQNMVVNPYLLACKYEDYRVVLFQDGRAIIHGTHEPTRARIIYNKLVG
ncbi:ThiF family adenylyltransferase [Niallia sp. 01092]|uniref:ThiF family adenylyltransferase n=1 Tax=unclassified Niallia TaxID=2837522 RepID=UPI003FD38624